MKDINGMVTIEEFSDPSEQIQRKGRMTRKGRKEDCFFLELVDSTKDKEKQNKQSSDTEETDENPSVCPSLSLPPRNLYVGRQPLNEVEIDALNDDDDPSVCQPLNEDEVRDLLEDLNTKLDDETVVADVLRIVGSEPGKELELDVEKLEPSKARALIKYFEKLDEFFIL